MLVSAQLGFSWTPAAAVSGTAIITGVGPASNLGFGEPIEVAGTGCLTPGGSANAAELFVRGPTPSTALLPQTLFGPAVVVDAGGGFRGTVILLPVPNGAVDSTFILTARCTEQGGAPGLESAGVPLTVSRRLTLPRGSSTGGPATTQGTTGTTGAAGGRGATTSVATPIGGRPTFTG